MYLTALPDHSQPGFDEQKHFSMFGRRNIVVNAHTTKAGCDNHVGCLSIKTVSSGEEWYGVGGRSVAVRPGTFLLLNQGQNYSCRIDSSVRTMSVFFGTDFARSVFHDYAIGIASGIDDPFNTGEQLPEFFQVLHLFDRPTQQQLRALISSLDAYGYKTNMVDEHLVFLLRNLLNIHGKDVRASKNIEAQRASTQKEIYRRVCIARDMLHSYYGQDTSLRKIALASSLSVPQLVRQFQAAFGKTPHRYLIDVRLEEASRLLRSSSMQVAEISLLCGFEDASAFARAFRNRFKQSPSQFRVTSSARH